MSRRVSSPTANAAHPASKVRIANGRLSDEQAIPRSLVHKNAIAEVFVTDSVSVGADSMLIAGELPRTHYYYNDPALDSARFDLIAILELCRQACFVMAHRHYRVPIGRQFVLRSIGARLSRMAFDRHGDQPLRVVVRCDAARRWEREGELVGVSWKFTVQTSAGVDVASADAAMSWTERTAWESLRRGQRAKRALPPRIEYRRPCLSQVPATSVGRESARNVVLRDLHEQAGVLHGKLVVDITHPGLFDHYVDHLSGMLEAEACRQAAIWSARRRRGEADWVVEALTLDFTGVGELDLSTHCEGFVRKVRTSPDNAHVVALRLVQREIVLCEARAEVVTRTRAPAEPTSEPT
jgi:hypothetical protein